MWGGSSLACQAHGCSPLVRLWLCRKLERSRVGRRARAFFVFFLFPFSNLICVCVCACVYMGVVLMLLASVSSAQTACAACFIGSGRRRQSAPVITPYQILLFYLQVSLIFRIFICLVWYFHWTIKLTKYKF